MSRKQKNIYINNNFFKFDLFLSFNIDLIELNILLSIMRTRYLEIN